MEVINDVALKLQLRHPQKVLSVIPDSKLIEQHEDGRGVVIVRWGVEQAQVLKNLNIKNVPSPISRKYAWPGSRTPFAHQIQTSSFLTLHRRAFVFNDAGTGKSASVIWAADYLMSKKIINRVLVICPMSVMQAAWMGDLFQTAMHRSADIAHGSREKRKQVIRGDAEFVIINFDGVKIMSKEIAQAGFDLVVIDEANYVKNANTDRWKAINGLIRPSTWLWMLTGTPASQSPTDAFGLAKMMNPTSVPRSFNLFRDQVMTKISLYKWTPKSDAIHRVNQILQPAIRFTKDECLDLPDIIYTTRDVPLSSQQKKLYDQLRKSMVANCAGETVSAVNAAVGLQKLAQASAGAVFTDNDKVIELDIAPRYNVLTEVLDEAPEKVLVFAAYTHVLDQLHEKLTGDGYTVEMIRGDVSATRRAKVIDDFQNKSDPRVLLIQPQAASHGVTLHAASTIVWWGPVFSYETYVQANARIHRAGQTKKCRVVRLQGSPVERLRFAHLDKAEDTNESLLKMFKEVLTM